VRNLRYETVNFWPDETNEIQLRRFTDEVVAGVGATLGIDNNRLQIATRGDRRGMP